MRTTLVDSNVIVDVLGRDPTWFEWSSEALATLGDDGRLAINQLIYAEVSANFSAVEDANTALSPWWLERLSLPWDAAFLAAAAFREHRRRGGSRRSPLPDFYIGAHAAVARYTLLTRDARRYRTYFPRLEIVAPN